ncbi:MAG TPA: DUF2304 domain-containing protein [Solirubrobacteraceae bacterium]|jgi:hypothetical protein|nr:DUF2304 domain-containing protein [Solirubrobacteraceae bacterium]
MISANLRIVAILASVGLLVYIVDLVRRRRLKEEYTALWVIVAIVLLVLAAWGGLLHSITHAIGAVSESSTLYLFGLLFVILLLLNFSVRVSMLERRLTALVQELALLSGDRRNGQAAPEREAAHTSGAAGPGQEEAAGP